MMDAEQDLAIVAAAGLAPLSAARARHLKRPGEPCDNCGVSLAGPYCHACGQLAEAFDHRTLASLATETFENLFHADGRLFRTLPGVFLRPASLTRDYLAGRRASQLPPLRLFLVAVLVFFLAGEVRDAFRPHRAHAPVATLQTPAPRADIEIGHSRLPWLAAWLNPRIAAARAHPEELGAAMKGGLHDLAIVFLPIATVLLTLLFPFSRRWRIYDHAIFSMHSLAFVALLFTAATLLEGVPVLPGVLPLAAPVHLFVHMRGVYRTSIPGTLIRMAVLFVLSMFALAVGSVVLVVIGLNSLVGG